MQYPRYRPNAFIEGFIKELDRYASVFHDRIATAFSGLEEEAKRVEEAEYARIGEFVDPYHTDGTEGAEEAYFKGVEHFLAIDAIRQGFYNLAIAGLFHLLEQQAQYLAIHVLSLPKAQPDSRGGFQQLKELTKLAYGVDFESLRCWLLLAELRLVANTVKHGDGRSAAELRALNPSLFKDPNDPLPQFDGLPLRPLVGEGLRLAADHFNAYKSCVERFWQELAAAFPPED